MFILAILAFYLAFFKLVACSLPNDLKQNILDDLKSFLKPDESLKLEMLKADQFETVIKFIYSKRLTIGTGSCSKLSFSVKNYGKILTKSLQNTIVEPQYTELMKIVEKVVDYYTSHGFGPSFSEKFYQQVLEDYKNSVVTLSPSSFKLALKLNDLFDEINFRSRPLYKLFNENKSKAEANRFYFCGCCKFPTVDEQNDCIKGYLEYEGIPLNHLQSVKSTLETIFPKWEEFAKIHKEFYSIPVEKEVGRVIKKESELVTENVAGEERGKIEEDPGKGTEIETGLETETNSKLKTDKNDAKKAVKVENEAENPIKAITQEDKKPKGLSLGVKIALMITLPLIGIIGIIIIITLVRRGSLHSAKNP